MLSQMFSLSGRGDTVVGRDYRYDVPRTSHDTFFRLVKCGDGDDGEAAAPVFFHDGVNFFHVKVRTHVGSVSLKLATLTCWHCAHPQAGGLYFCATSRENLSPSLVLELLLRIARVIKVRLERLQMCFCLVLSVLTHPGAPTQDYCGVLTEESLRKNFVLVYELLDEMVDFGYGQSTSTEALKASIFNDPVTPPQPRACHTHVLSLSLSLCREILARQH